MFVFHRFSHRLNRLTLLILLSVLMITPIAPIYAQQSNELTFTLDDLGYSDIPINGAFGTAQLYIPIPASWQASQNAQVSVDIISSPLLKPESSLTVSVNDQPLSSIGLNGTTQRLQFEIPAALITPPGISVQFRAYMSVTDDDCEDSNIPSQWARVLPTTQIAFTVQQSPRQPDLADLNNLLFSRDLSGKYRPLLFVLPTNPDSNTLTAAVRVAAGLGHMVNHDAHPLGIATADNVTERALEASNVVLIGLPGDQPLLDQVSDNVSTMRDDKRFYTSDGALVPDSDGVLQIFRSQWNAERTVLVVSANHPDGLNNLGQAMLNPATMGNLNGNFVFVARPLPEDNNPLPTPWSTAETSLAQLGFGSRTVRGTGVTNEYYTLSRAPGSVFDGGGQFVLKGSASPLLRNEESYVAVFMNESPLGAYPISQLLDNGSIAFQIPTIIDSTAYRPRMNLRIEVSNQIRQQECQTIDRDNAWTQIDMSSAFVVNNVHLPVPSLQAFPYPFVAESEPAPVRIVLPENAEYYHLSGAIRMAFTFGFFMTTDIDVSTQTISEFSAENADSYRDNNLVFLVNSNEEPDINAIFPQPVQPGATPTAEPVLGGTTALTDLSLYRTLSDPFGLLFTAKSPINPDRVVLFVLSETARGFNAAIDGLTVFTPPVSVPATLAIVQPNTAPYVLTRAEDVQALAPDTNTPTPAADPTTTADTSASTAPLPLSANNASFIIIVIPIVLSLALIVVVWALQRGKSA
jgi:hypothetical protein